MTTITPLPIPPTRDDPANFSDRADQFLGALPLFASEVNAVAGEANAAAATAINAPGTAATSTTTLIVGGGAKSLTIQTGKAFVVGQFVMIARTSSPSTWMHGQITGYNSGTGALNVFIGATAGAGSLSDWTVSLSLPQLGVPASGGTFTGNVDGCFRATTQVPPAGGAGVEMVYASGNGYVQSYDRTASAYRPLYLAGQSLTLDARGGAATLLGALSVSVSISRAGSTVWDAANDGAGSGLDADLLDGRQANEFALLNNSATFTGFVMAPIFYSNGDSDAVFIGRGTAPYYTFHNKAGSVRYGYIQHSSSSLVIANEQSGTLNFDTAGGNRLAISSTAAAFTVAIYRNGNLSWDAGNDGAGSGLDADLLDGFQASDFAQLGGGASFNGSVIGLTPNDGSSGGLRVRGNPTSGNAIIQFLNPAGTGQWGFILVDGSGVMRYGSSTVWHAGNDGSGSGLDADLLDGQDGGYYSNIVARLGYTPFNAAGGTVNGDVSANIVSARTPNDGTTGGFRLLANAGSGLAYQQILNSSGTGQFGYWRYDSAGTAEWSNTIRAPNIVATSDARLKEHVATIGGAGAIVARLRGVRFDWRDGRGASLGVIAQEVRDVLPELVDEGSDGILAVNHNGLVGVLIEAVKALSARVAALEAA